MNKLTDTYVSVVILVRNHAGSIAPFVKQTVVCLESTYSNFEVILVDDGSTDDSKGECMRSLAAHDGVRLIEFSRNFGDECAYRAGLDNAIGDVVLTLSIDHDSPDMISAMVSACLQGGGVAAGVDREIDDEGVVRRFCSEIYHRFLRISLRVSPVSGSGYCWAFSRTAVNVLLAQPSIPLLLRFNAAQLGLPIARVNLRPVAGVRPRPRVLLNDVLAGLSVVFAHSKLPFRALFVAAGFSMLGIVIWLCFAADLPAAAQKLGFYLAGAYFMLTGALWLLGEHLARNLQASARGAAYLIVNEFASGSTLRNVERRNVIKE